MNKLVIFCSGVAVGVFGVKTFPKTKAVRYTKFAIEVFKAQSRLSKILIEEYHRIDEALDTEQKFINMIAPDNLFSVIFGIIDENGQRKIRVDVKKTSNQEED